LLGVVLLVLPAVAQLGPDGTNAHVMARAADDTAAEAHAEGADLLKQLETLKAERGEVEGLPALQEQAAQALEALARYRKLAQASASETFKLLADLGRSPAPDAIRREVVEQRALLAAHEAAVMAARARAEAERLRALAAEARALTAAAPAPGPAATPARPPGREVEVPNLVGARLDAAARDLALLGLRLGTTTGPRDGFVVKQVPAAGSRVARQSAVSVTLSATAAGVTTSPPR
jgi:hypothetical protein